ncbi:MAG TPA: hypothetical protein VF834_23140 [Streptosporangiaceae bacterium]
MSEMPGSFESGQPSDQQPYAFTEPAAQHPDFLKKPAQQTPAQSEPTQLAGSAWQPEPTQQVPQDQNQDQDQNQGQAPSYPPPTQAASVQPLPGFASGSPAEPGPAPVMGGEQVLVSIGDISVTATQVYTPSGTRPLSEVQWSVTDMSLTNQGIPTWAIVCAIVFFLFCLLGLLFLLVKETTTKGSVQVSVYGPGFVHTTQIPVFSPEQIADIHSRVSYVRTLNAIGQGQQPSPGQQPFPGQQPAQGW